MSDIARYYVPENNPNGAGYAGVPLDDITNDVFDALPAWLQAAVDKHPMYRKTKPQEAKASKPAKAKPEAVEVIVDAPVEGVAAVDGGTN